MIPLQRLSALLALLALASALGGCATRQDVMLAKAPTARIATVAQAPDEGNSPEMDGHLSAALLNQGLQIKAALAAGTRQSPQVDAVVSYVDVWRWDVVMYLQSLSVRVFDARTGDLLASGQWRDSALHGYRDARQVMDQLVAETWSRLRPAQGR
ncbi:hypothetical protein JI739_10310 [Ramlibacter sp. AW1]|uniref:Lipoprotein n=1 Tax=Ramlibacter aurantiacus TaxID=2801330 RepID=A0A936ZJ08_9BURK|nr:hypothetical protein [Ramlibacter aurantiacus]MBL0420737.1 hypothetical protein [Ramlibacter aurantiacus]